MILYPSIRNLFFCFGKINLTDLDSHFLYRQNHMGDLTKTELQGKILKLLKTDRDMSFLSSLDEKDLTTLLVALRERIEHMK